MPVFYTFLFQKSPCVILDVSSKPGEEVIPAHILSAAQDLCRAGLRVVVDASQGQLGTAPITGRALPYYIDFMEQALSLPRFCIRDPQKLNSIEGLVFTAAFRRGYS